MKSLTQEQIRILDLGKAMSGRRMKAEMIKKTRKWWREVSKAGNGIIIPVRPKDFKLLERSLGEITWKHCY